MKDVEVFRAGGHPKILAYHLHPSRGQEEPHGGAEGEATHGTEPELGVAYPRLACAPHALYVVHTLGRGVWQPGNKARGINV